MMDPQPVLDLIDRRQWDDRRAAVELGVSERSVAAWRAGTSEPTLETLDRIAVHLGHHPASLWGPGWDHEVPIRPRLLRKRAA